MGISHIVDINHQPQHSRRTDAADTCIHGDKD